MNRPVPECAYCGEPATHEAETRGLFGPVIVPVCIECGLEIAELVDAGWPDDAA
jgi:hypothetical protein